jgi:hypothetical protein
MSQLDGPNWGGKDKGEPPDAFIREDVKKTEDKTIDFTSDEKHIMERNGIKTLNCSDFSHSIVQKLESGRIMISGSNPCNVDPDWGTHDMRSWKRYYDSFEEFVEQNRDRRVKGRIF